MNHIIGKCTVLEKNMRDPIIRYIGDVATAISWGGTGRVNIMQMREEREAHTECTKNQIGHQPLEIIKKIEILQLRDYWSTRTRKNENVKRVFKLESEDLGALISPAIHPMLYNDMSTLTKCG